MVNSNLKLSYEVDFRETDSRLHSPFTMGKKYSLDNLDIKQIIAFLGKNNFRVIEDQATKDSEVWEKHGLEQIIKDLPLESRFGQYHREEVRRYFLPATNNGKYLGFDQTKYNKVGITITDRDYAKAMNGRKNELIWRLDMKDDCPSMDDAQRMILEFEDVVYDINGQKDLLERLRSKKVLVKK